MKATLPLVGGYSLERDPKIDCQRTINMYAVDSPDGKNPSALVPMPGIAKAIDFIQGTEGRGIYETDNTMYAVMSDNVYQIDQNMGFSKLGTIATGTGNVGISSNATQVIFVDGQDGWLWTKATSSFVKITAPGFPGQPQSVAFLDGFFVVNHGSTNQFQISGLNDGTTWDASKVAELTSRPDVIVSLACLKRRLFLFCTKSTEVWYNAGQTDFPFRRDNNLLLEYGCAAPGSIAVGYERILWLAGDENGVGSIVMTDGTVPTPVSTPAVDYAIQKYSTVSDAQGYLYKIDGHIFYEISFTAANQTWVYDLTTNKWFERQALGGGRYLGAKHAFLNQKHFLLAHNSSDLYELSSDYVTDDGLNVLRTRITRHFAEPNYRKIRINRLTLDVVSGLGNINDPDSEGLIYMSTSQDGGVSFGNKVAATMGKIGDRLHRTIWRRLGSGRDWVFKFEFSNKLKLFLLGASIDFEISGR